MTWEVWTFLGLVGLLVSLLVGIRRQESRKLKSRTRELLSPSLREEFENERSEDLEKKQKFEEALRQAEGSSAPQISRDSP
ncbi:MAG: hypothetical protein HYY44_08165 [Deltaproteobacteria bacterium]|nr:hypothetical protein [Deltaproteobacteria bacterium]